MAPTRALTAKYLLYGYRRIQGFLGRKGNALIGNRAHRLRSLQCLQVPTKHAGPPVAANPPRPFPATDIGHVRGYNYMLEACANGHQIMCLTGAH